MKLHSETVTPGMQDIAQALSGIIDDAYYLAGGTALALRIGHRKSIALDYFIEKPIDTLQLKESILDRFSGDAVITFEEKNTLWAEIGGVKVSFISRFESLLDQVHSEANFPLAGLKDITVMKLSALCGREEYKDYFDLACMTRHTDVRAWYDWWQRIYPNQDASSWIVGLAAVDTVSSVPLETFGEYRDMPVSQTIVQAVRDITTYTERTLR